LHFRSQPTAGRKCVLEIAQSGAIGVSLACLIGKSYGFPVYRVVQGFFLGGIHLKMRFGIAESQVDALFRLKSFSFAEPSAHYSGSLTNEKLGRLNYYVGW
jgi:hypothetical protein